MLYISYLVTRYGVLTILGTLWQPNAIIPMSYLIIFVNMSFIALWVMGLISASNNEDRPIPLFGKPAQFIFARI